MRGGPPLKTFRLMKSKRWAPLWADADSKKCQTCVVQMTKKPGTLFLLYTLSTQGVSPPLATTSLGQDVTYLCIVISKRKVRGMCAHAPSQHCFRQRAFYRKRYVNPKENIRKENTSFLHKEYVLFPHRISVLM